MEISIKDCIMKNNTKIAVLSGKGGTGKTLISVNLASVAGKSVYMDCDVEEPNGYLFFKPDKVAEDEVSVCMPYVFQQACNGCRRCTDFCKFNALAYIVNKLIIFEEVCHSCGGCVLLCPAKALLEKNKVIGKIQKGVSENVEIYTGILNVGEVSGIPIIKKMFDQGAVNGDKPVFIDCPPGSACIAMESIRNADYCVLVAEPTLFGVHNLDMVHKLVRLFNKPYGAVLNKCISGKNPAEDYCADRDIRILGRIDFDNELGILNSNALIAARESEKYKKIFSSILKKITEEVRHETASHPQR